MIHPDIMEIAREEDVYAWRARHSRRIRRQQRVRIAAKATYWAGALALIGWVTWDGVTRIGNGLLW